MVTCSAPTQPEPFISDGDATFTVRGVTFPNDTIFNRALTGSGEGSRWRLRRFFDKCKYEDEVAIGFIGGSITAGAAASREPLKFSSLLCEWIRQHFIGLKKVKEINAGIGATDSRFGCSRVDDDVLAFSPDLIIIEYAVNDFGIGEDRYIQSTMEGLVRKCLSYRNDVPVMLLFMARGDGDSSVQALQAEVGNHYSLPMISYRDAIWPLVETDWNYWSIFFHDSPHPNDTGHRVCAYLLYSYLKKAESFPEGQAAAMPAVLYSNLFQNAGILSSNDTAVSIVHSGWPVDVKEQGRIGFSSSQAFDTLTLETRCDEITLCIRARPENISSVRVVIDSGMIDTVLTNYFGGDHMNVSTFFTSRSSSIHAIRIDHLDDHAFSFDYILYAHY